MCSPAAFDCTVLNCEESFMSRHVKTETCLLSSVFCKTLQHSNPTLLWEEEALIRISSSSIRRQRICAPRIVCRSFLVCNEYRWQCYTRYCELVLQLILWAGSWFQSWVSLSQAPIAHVPSVCLPHFLPVKSVLVKKCVKCKMRAKMLRMSDIWRRMMGFERMLSDLWVAPPGGYLRHLGPSPLTAVQRGATFLWHPFLICSSRLWTTTSVRHQNLLCQQRWDTFKRFNKNLFNIFQWILCEECAIGAKWFEGSLQSGHWATLVTQFVCCCFYIL